MSHSPIAWYWRRLRAMNAAEMALHARKKFRQFVDGRRQRDWASVRFDCSGAFPNLPKPEDAPRVVREALEREAKDILAGRWKAFGHLDLEVDDPPLWQCDYLAGKNLATRESAFKLDHRALPDGADIKLVWELSRWHPLVRLAMAAYVLGDERAGLKCVEWLEDWVKHNPPYRGWNWTSALEAGMRLIQFTWIDALLTRSRRREAALIASAEGQPADQSLLTSAATVEGRLAALREQILPPHVWFAWRHQSFGSSANNHLLGELAGCLLVTVRWPALARWGAPLEELQRRWEHEVLAQFAEDGGNKEQALNYQLFSFELCWQARMALFAANRKVSPQVERRLESAARFFWEVQARNEPWDYGDSDNAFITPFFTSNQTVARAWRDWISRRHASGSLEYWLGDAPDSPRLLCFGQPINAAVCGDWWFFEDSGMAVCESGFWWLRWDLSPLGYLTTAAHGHLDALHLSIWFKGVALVVDPGTGAYYADQNLRSWLASRAAHNGPCPEGDEYPERLGAFLWSEPHAVPTLKDREANPLGLLNLPGRQLRRRIRRVQDGLVWRVEDEGVAQNGTGAAFSVRWQFAPGTTMKILSERKFAVHRLGVCLQVEVASEWAGVKWIETEADRAGDLPLAGTVSPAFRKTCFAPYLLLKAAGGDKSCVFCTTFLASAHT